MIHTRLLAVTAAAVLALSACTGGSDDTTTGSATTSETGAGQTDAGATEGAEHSAADVMFARMMIPHHQQAIEMSDRLLAKDDIPADVQTLAVQIKAAQGPELQQLGQWLEMWGQSTGAQEGGDGGGDDGGGGGGGGGDDDEGHSGHDMGSGMGDDAGEAEGSSDSGGSGEMPMMEGMLSAQEMQELSDAQGVDAARLFLEQMIAHHEGAIGMAQDEVADGTYPPAVEMARTIIDTQQREIDQMRAMLAAL